MTTTVPSAPNHAVFIGIVTRKQSNNGRILVAIQNGYELQELHNVSITTPTDGQALIYEAASGLWKNITIPQGITIGTTPITSGTDGRVLFQNGGVVSQSANLFWDNTNGRLGIGGTPSAFKLDVNGTSRVQSLLSVNGTDGISLYGTTNLELYTGSGLAIMRTAGNVLILGANNAERMRLSGTNILIGTTTDAGYKLDVNGTARVKGTGTGGGTFALTVQNSASTNIMRLQDDGYLNVLAGVFTSAIRGVNVEFTNLLYGANFWCTVDGSIKIGSGQSPSVASAIFQADSTTRGFLPPRMTTTQKNAIATPATGLMIYDNVLNRPCFYDGTTWITL
jgi:hypothetical protein